MHLQIIDISPSPRLMHENNSQCILVYLIILVFLKALNKLSTTCSRKPLNATKSSYFTFIYCFYLISLFVDMYRFADDYRVALQQSYMWTTQQELPDAQGFFARPQRRRQSTRTKTLVHTLSFWCLNPAVVRTTLLVAEKTTKN